MTVGTPEMHKKPGVFYAVGDEGIELPIIDVTNPAFSIEMSDGELDRLLQEHIRTVERRAKVPAFIQNLMLRFMMRQSRIMRALSGAAGGFLGGMDTYLLKLGPDNMGSAYASAIDRQISASLPGLSIRMRLQYISHLLADGVEPALAAAQGQPLHLLNIGGGPAIDSLNTLIILRGQQPDPLTGRSIRIHILDLDESGPRFGGRALTALQEAGAPLHGLDIQFQHIEYNWSDTSILREFLGTLESQAVVAASSEGALFEYGTDEDVTANLRALHDHTPAAAVVAGSVTRADTTGRLMNGSSRAALQMRGIEAFLALTRAAGWDLAKRLDRPSGHDIRLIKAQ